MKDNHQILVKTRAANADRFIELLTAAIGTRSLREFARLCDCSAAALTRILHKQNTGASRIKLIEAIAQNADPRSGVTLEMLAEANGYTLQDVIIQSDSLPRQATQMSQAELAAQAIFIQDFTCSGKTVRILPCDHRIGDYAGIKPDLLIEASDLGGKPELFFCEFLNGMSRTQETIRDRIDRYTLVNAFKDDGTPTIHFHLLVVDLEACNTMSEFNADRKLPINLTLGLIDLGERKIAAQYTFPTKTPDWFCEMSKTVYIPVPNSQTEQMVVPIENIIPQTKKRRA